MKLTIVLLLAFLAGILLTLGIYFYQRGALSKTVVIPIISESPPPRTAFSIENPPKDSIIGNIASMSGSIYLQNRTATEPAQIISPTDILQGEYLLASDSGKVKVQFNQAGDISLEPKSDVAIIQTLPSNFVFQQNSGAISYDATDDTPFSIRTNYLLTYLPRGEVKISFSSETPTITVSVASGSATVAFNNLQFNSRVASLSAGDNFVFNTAKRQGTLK